MDQIMDFRSFKIHTCLHKYKTRVQPRKRIIFYCQPHNEQIEICFDWIQQKR